ncbi:hypothetical protein V2J52_01030 [Georgenia sp. MJ173]|uniref:hypothetical protein n=1 Tax=Georgenia sunbinii TaxID=3117728 RepID=UPI002F26CA2D
MAAREHTQVQQSLPAQQPQRDGERSRRRISVLSAASGMVRLAPGDIGRLTPNDLRHLQRSAGNQAVGRTLAEDRPVQRWPDITSGDGTFNYVLGAEFVNKHVADSLAEARRKAQHWYDPEDPHRTAVTVILRSSLTAVTRAGDATRRHPYDWSLMIDVTGVTMGPSGRVGSNGDPGTLEDIESVVVSGYNHGAGGKITHVAAAQ